MTDQLRPTAPPDTDAARKFRDRQRRLVAGVYIFCAGFSILVGLAVVTLAPLEDYQLGLAAVLAFMTTMLACHLLLREVRPFAGHRMTMKEKMMTRQMQIAYIMDDENLTFEQAAVRLKEELKAQKERRRENKRRRRQGPSQMWGFRER